MMSALSLANGQVIFQGLMATDYGRFASQRIRYRGTASIMILELIPMLIVIGLGCFFGINLYGELSGPDAQSYAQDPGYLFVNVIGLLGVILVVVTQIRVNVMNLYSGSIALASGFEVAAKIKPGRPWWMFLIWGCGGSVLCHQRFEPSRYFPRDCRRSHQYLGAHHPRGLLRVSALDETR